MVKETFGDIFTYYLKNMHLNPYKVQEKMKEDGTYINPKTLYNIRNKLIIPRFETAKAILKAMELDVLYSDDELKQILEYSLEERRERAKLDYKISCHITDNMIQEWGMSIDEFQEYINIRIQSLEEQGVNNLTQYLLKLIIDDLNNTVLQS